MGLAQLKFAIAIVLSFSINNNFTANPQHMSTLDLRAYEIFKLKLGEKEAETVMEFFEARLEKKFAVKKEVLAMKGDFAQLRVEIKEQKSEIIKWMFIFWVGQIAATIGIILIKH